MTPPPAVGDVDDTLNEGHVGGFAAVESDPLHLLICVLSLLQVFHPLLPRDILRIAVAFMLVNDAGLPGVNGTGLVSPLADVELGYSTSELLKLNQPTIPGCIDIIDQLEISIQ